MEIARTKSIRTPSYEMYYGGNNNADFFHLLLTDDIINLIVRETNRYTAQYLKPQVDTNKL